MNVLMDCLACREQQMDSHSDDDVNAFVTYITVRAGTTQEILTNVMNDYLHKTAKHFCSFFSRNQPLNPSYIEPP